MISGVGKDDVMVTVRPIDPSEADALRSIRLAALAADPTAFGRTHDEEAAYDDDHWRMRAAGSPSSQMFVAVDGEFIGLVGAYQEAPDERVELVSMWTSPAARRRGVGHRLVRSVLDWAEERHAPSVELWVTRGNDGALALYRACGFEVTGEVEPSPADPCREEIRMRRPMG